MTNSELYRQQAREAEERAEKLSDPLARQAWIDVALQYASLAEIADRMDRERTLIRVR